MDAMTALRTRRSALRLTDPAPGTDELDSVLRAAARAPDHGRLRPWRFVLIEGEARARFGEVLAEALKARLPGASEAMVAREKDKALRAPLIIAAAALGRPEHPKIPEIERLLSAAAAVENMLLGFHALGYGAMWRTGEPAYDASVKEALGLDSSDHIVGFIYVGTHAAAVPSAEEPDLTGVVRRWDGAAN